MRRRRVQQPVQMQETVAARLSRLVEPAVLYLLMQSFVSKAQKLLKGKS